MKILKQDIHSLTALRFFAAMAIAIDHTWPVVYKFNEFELLNSSVHQLAYVGMTLFFVLSGFVIHYNYDDVLSKAGGVWQFVMARISRLYPLYLLLIVFELVVLNHDYGYKFFRMLTMTQSWTYEFDESNSPLFIGYKYSVVAWSISTEVFFYAVYPAIRLLIKKMGGRNFSVMTFVVSAAIIFGANHATGYFAKYSNSAFPVYDWLTYISPFVRVFEFMSGCALAVLYRSLGQPRKRMWSVLVCFALMYLFLFVARGYYASPAVSVLMREVGLLIPICVLIYGVAHGGVASIFSNKVFFRLGEASYSIYLVHLVFAEYFANLASVSFNSYELVNANARFLAAISCTLLLSLLLYQYFEMPAKKFVRNLTAKRVDLKMARHTLN